MRRLAAAALAAAALAAPAAAAAPALPPVTTLAVADTPITALAQDGARVAWATFDAAAACPATVTVRDLRRGTSAAVNTPGDASCAAPSPVTRLALAGSRVLWEVVSASAEERHDLYAASAAAPGARPVAGYAWRAGEDGRVALVGGGAVLGYAWSLAGTPRDDACPGRGRCPFTVQGGGFVRVGAARAGAATGAAAAAAALAGGRVALLSRGEIGARTNPHAELWQVQVLSPAGAPVAWFVVPAPVVELAASPAAIAARTAIARAELYTPAGRKLRTVRLPRLARDVGLAGDRVVYRVGRAIYVEGRGAPLALAGAAPVGLSVSGRRVAWAENASGRGRVQALELPAEVATPR